MPENKREGLFDKLYAAAKEVYDEARKPLVKNKIKRKLSSAYDDACAKISEAEMKIQKSREDFDNYNINTIIEQRMLISQAEQLKELVREEYLELFAKEMKVDED